MATITKKAETYQTLFDDVEEVLFYPHILKSSDIASIDLKEIIELPVVEDGVTLNTGDADVNQIKTTTGKIWTTKVKKGDADFGFHVPSVSDEINDLFMRNTGQTAKLDLTGIRDLGEFVGAGYSLSPKKVVGSFILLSNGGQTVYVFPNVEIYASFVAADGDTPAYFNLKCYPLSNEEGVEMFPLISKKNKKYKLTIKNSTGIVQTVLYLAEGETAPTTYNSKNLTFAPTLAGGKMGDKDVVGTMAP